jgi:N-acetylglucosaminyl-diphospho-decaprenol L-rhamnosyltransferase
MSDTPKVAFILVCWNNQDLLKECFESIAAQEYKNHVTVMVDNGSKDESVAYTRQHFPWVDVLEAGANLGFAKGNNRGIAYAREKYEDVAYVVFLNTDARIEPDWLGTLVAFAARKPLGALFQSTTLDYYDHSVTDSTHIYVSQNGSGTQAGWRTPYLGERGPKKVFGVNAAAAMASCRFIDAQPFKSLFDETMFMYLEDVDLSARATVMGWDNYLVPGTGAYHMGSASSGKNPGFSLYMTYRNNIAMLAKNIPFGMLIKMVPSVIRSDRHTLRHLKRTGQAGVRSKLIKGRLVGLLRLPLYTPGIFKMRRYRNRVSKDYLRQLMNRGY